MLLSRVFALTLVPACQSQINQISGEGGHEGGSDCPAACGECGRPNVVLVVMESFSYRAVTPYAPDLPTTPFLDRLARDNVRFDTMYTVVPHTTKALVPLQCGFYPKVAKEIVEPDAAGLPGTCLAARLDSVGYSTLFISPTGETFENRRGLVDNFGFADFASKLTLPSEGFDESSYFGFEDDIMLEPALEWVDEQRCPFFLSVLTLTAHHDYGVPAGFPVEPHSDDEVYNNYLNTVAYTDRFVGKLYDGLAERGLLDNTYFVAVGDHGEAFGEHGRFQHDNVIWEEGLRVPLIMSGPGIGPPGRVVKGLFQTLDLAPTIERLLGLDLGPSEYVGVDLLESAGHDRLVFSCWSDDRCMALREGDRKVIYHYDAKPTVVHDLVADPLETTNVISEGDNQGFADAAVAAMLAWKQATNARYDGL